MAPKVIPFPARKAPCATERSTDSLARDTQHRACCIASQVEQEIARKSERYATGARPSRVRHKVIVMPAAPTPTQARKQGFLTWFLTARTAAFAMVAGIFSL